jgi:5-methylcytosine-specific restriction endonuclease McrA
MTKTCKKCGETKPIDEFQLVYDGSYRRGNCRVCSRNRGGIYYKPHPRTVRATELTCRTCKKCGETMPIMEFPVSYAAKDGGLYRSRSCRDCARAQWRDCYRRHPETSKRSKHARRARELGAEGRFTQLDLKVIAWQQDWKCAACKKARKLTIDHIVALSEGGSNYPRNIQMLCAPCNFSKKATSNAEFLSRICGSSGGAGS